MDTTPRDGAGSDIRKMGVLKKLKTNKKKFFVLRQSSGQGPARIEYYDTEKKFKNNSKANRSIELKACFNISKKQDTKHKYAIALYTKDDCFSLVMESVAEQEAWLQALTELQNEEYGDDTSSRLVFDFVWQVTVKNSGLGLERGITGRYRLCLSDKFLGLMKMSSEVPELSFQLNVIRKCGHTEQFFVLEVGRSSPIGAGELLMQVDDILIAQQMHEEILSAMKAAKASQEQITIRPRTRSAIDKNKPGSTRSSTASTSPYQSQSLNQQDQMRGRTMSEGQKSAVMSSPRARLNLSPKLGDGRSTRPASTYTRSGSVSAASPFSSTSSIHGEQGGHRYRSDSTGSRGTSASGASVDEMDSSPVGSYHGLNRSLTPDYPIREEGTEGPDYLTMSYGRGSCSSSSASTSCSSLDKRQQADAYMDMAPVGNMPASQEASEYVDMSAGSISSSKSSLSSVSRSGHGKDQVDAPGGEDCGYVDMGSVSQSLPTVRERTAPEGYCEMTAGQDVYSPSGPSLGLRPDKVYSYLSEEPLEDFPKRAYSVGSKPELKLKPRPYLESIVLNKTDSQKSSSAPHLNADKIPGHQRSVSQSHSPVGSQSPGSQKSLSRRTSREDTELFMEMSFDRPRTSSESHGSNYTRVRTSSWGQNFRPRSSSHSQAQRTYRRTPDSKHSSQELKKDSRSSSQEMGSHDLHSKHHSSSESVKRGSQESLKKISHERQGSIEKAKRAAKDNTDNSEYMMALPVIQKSMPVPPVITGVATSGEDYMAMSPGSYQGSYGQRHSPTSLRRSPILEGESVIIGVEDKYGRGQGNRGHHSLTPGKSGSMKVRKESASNLKMRRGYSADSSDNYMALGVGEKSKLWRDEIPGGDSYLLTAPGKHVSNPTVVTAAMMDKIISPYGPSHMRTKSPMSVGSHSSVDSSDDYCTMETDSSSRLSDTGSNSSGCFDPFQLIRKPELDQGPQQHGTEKNVARKLDYDSVKSPADSKGLKTLDSGELGRSVEIGRMEPAEFTPKPQSPEAGTPDSIRMNHPVSNLPLNRDEKKDPFGLFKPEPIKPDVSQPPTVLPLDISKYPVPSIPCPRSPLDEVESVLPEDVPSGMKRSSFEAGETSAFVPGQRRSLSDLSPVEKSNPPQYNRSVSNQSTSSEEHKLNYAALDLDSSEDLHVTGGATKSDSDVKPLQYAQIDFVKSEGLKSSSSNPTSKTTKPPF